jgi:1-acyl-sn-glycerol-3-phosphate acyltransferase
MQTLIRRALRLSRLTAHLALGLFQAGVMFGFYSGQRKDQAISRWSEKLLRIMRVRLEADSPPIFPHGALLVANHISWLDIFVIHAVRRVNFVSKHEVRDWPVVGWLAHRAGTLFIQRAKKTDTLRINDEMHALLQHGAWVAVFPEGTSTDGRKLLRFRSSLFQPAITENLPVIPVALRYLTTAGDLNDAAAYADDLSFGASLWNIAGEKDIVVRLQFCAPIHGQDRRSLAAAAYREIAICLGFEQMDNSPGSPCDLPAAMP